MMSSCLSTDVLKLDTPLVDTVPDQMVPEVDMLGPPVGDVVAAMYLARGVMCMHRDDMRDKRAYMQRQRLE